MAGETRERILDVALDLFTDQGFDATSLREIADRIGVTKAALYYHFASKEEILLALHLRLHELGGQALARFGEAPSGTRSWGRLLAGMVDDMLANRKIFLLHERNQAAFEQLHYQREHEQMHGDMEAILRRLLADPSVPLPLRVRLSCTFGALMAGVLSAGSVFADVPSETLGRLLREVVVGLMVGDEEPRATG